MAPEPRENVQVALGPVSQQWNSELSTKIDNLERKLLAKNDSEILSAGYKEVLDRVTLIAGFLVIASYPLVFQDFKLETTPLRHSHCPHLCRTFRRLVYPTHLHLPKFETQLTEGPWKGSDR